MAEKNTLTLLWVRTFCDVQVKSQRGNLHFFFFCVLFFLLWYFYPLACFCLFSLLTLFSVVRFLRKRISSYYYYYFYYYYYYYYYSYSLSTCNLLKKKKKSYKIKIRGWISFKNFPSCNWSVYCTVPEFHKWGYIGLPACVTICFRDMTWQESRAIGPDWYFLPITFRSSNRVY